MATAPSDPPLEVRAASLFDIDPDLGETLDAAHLAEARARAVVAVLDLPRGSWSPVAVRELASRPFALLVVDGLLVRELVLAGSTATDLLGPGDLVDPREPEEALLPTTVHWSVPDAARLAVLDDRLLAILRTWPLVGRLLLDRAARRSARLVTHRAIAQLPRVDQRLLAFFGHLAERWGRVTPAGLVVPLHLTHETLGRLIGARRPTVSLALKDLSGSGLLERRGDGAWLLRYEAFDALSEGTAAGPWLPAEAHHVPDDAGEEHIAPARVAVGRADLAALTERIEMLHSEHVALIARCTSAVDRVRATRLGIQSVRGARSRP